MAKSGKGNVKFVEMKVGVDARALSWAGLGRYTRNLLKAMTDCSQQHDFAVFAPKEFREEVLSLRRTRFIPVTSSYYSLREQTIFLSSLLKERTDLIHFLHFNAPIFYRRPFVVTIHDLTRFYFPAQKNKGNFHQWAYEKVFRSVANRARKIITVSEHTRRDLIRYFPKTSAKTAVIYEGVDHCQFNCNDIAEENDQETIKALGIEGNYLLFVGVWMTHKNLPRLLQSFRKLREKGYRGKLVITGEGKPHHVNVPKLINELNLTDVITPGFVEDEKLPALYRRAELFVFPSLYEGFGLPPLEAMACGVPVAASRVSSIPEILGDCAAYFDPYSVEGMAETVFEILNDEKKKNKIIALGKRQAEKYSWEKCAEETLRVYNEFK